MIKGCYIGKSPEPDYSLVSTGDYLNPISPVFRLKGTSSTLEKVQTLYLIVNDISVEFAKIKVIGQMTTIRIKLSLDQKEWKDEIEFQNIDALGTVVVKPFYVKFLVDDVLEYYNLRNAASIKNFKLRLIYN